eukprot:8907814-Heterocapsa_arctica.AAC.1
MYSGLDSGAVIKARAVRRLAPPDRRNGAGLLKIRGLPWKPNPDRDDPEVRVSVVFDRLEVDGPIPPRLSLGEGPRRSR